MPFHLSLVRDRVFAPQHLHLRSLLRILLVDRSERQVELLVRDVTDIGGDTDPLVAREHGVREARVDVEAEDPSGPLDDVDQPVEVGEVGPQLEVARAAGPRLVLSSDAGQPDSPPPPEALRNLVEALADEGLDRAALEDAADSIPRKLILL